VQGLLDSRSSTNASLSTNRLNSHRICGLMPSHMLLLDIIFMQGTAYTPIENKVRAATSNEPWGCSSSDMREIADYTRVS